MARRDPYLTLEYGFVDGHFQLDWTKYIGKDVTSAMTLLREIYGSSTSLYLEQSHRSWTILRYQHDRSRRSAQMTVIAGIVTRGSELRNGGTLGWHRLALCLPSTLTSFLCSSCPLLPSRTLLTCYGHVWPNVLDRTRDTP